LSEWPQTPITPGDGAFSACGKVEIAGDEKIRPALKDDVLDAVAIARQGLSDLRVQRRFFGQRAKALVDALLHGLHISLGIRFRFQSITPGIATLLGGTHFSDEPVLHHAWETVQCRHRGCWRVALVVV
jgi:hypothetical protein